MILDPIAIAERFFRSNLQSLWGQVNILHELGHHRDKADLVENAQQMTLHLINLINDTEEKFDQELWRLSEKILNQTATGRDTVKELAKHTGGAEMGKLAENLSKIHTNAVKKLGEAEVRISAKMSQRFKVMRDDAQKVLLALEKMP